ncbi:hypothetical protein LSAT2_021667 [Lamellibrachia satsuma]|nr:hypothetical protein LSAT2_021667 [Lamellibrachia satsuma]
MCLMILITNMLLCYHQFTHTKLPYDTDTSCKLVEPGLSFNATSSNIDVGQTELEQYYRYTQFKNLKHENFNRSFSMYSYSVIIIEDRPTTDGIFVRIKEHFMNKSTHGGSSFIITANHIASEQCPYRDMFNGTYLAWCPPMTVGERREIVVTLQYVNFDAFDRARPIRFDAVIYHTQVRLDMRNRNPAAKVDIPTSFGSPPVAEALKTYARKQDVVLWYKDSENWKVKLANGEHFWSLSTKRMCDCIKKMRRLVMIGSSHMRYKFAYIAQQCYHRTGVGFTGRSNQSVENVKFVEFLLALNFTWSLHRKMKGVHLGDNDVVLVQTGVHDLAKNGLSYFMNSMVKYVEALVAVRNQSKVRRHNFIVLTPPPFPMYATVTRMKGDRNSFCTAASVRRLKQLLCKHDFEVFDEFSILRPVAERDLCTGRYICPMFNGKTFGVYGDVGFAAARLMMSQVCKANERWLSPCE